MNLLLRWSPSSNILTTMNKSIFLSLLTPTLLFAENSTKKTEQKLANQSDWVSLFDGETLTGWTNKEGHPAKEGKWVAANGVLSRVKKGAGDLYSAQAYQDFELAFEWKLEKGSNSGVKYRVQEIDGKTLGLEYQILDDDNHPDGKQRDHQSAALYDLRATNSDKKLNPIGEWNSSRIVVHDGLVQHFLNGALVVEIKIPSKEWHAAFEQSKYKKLKNFGTNQKGLLMLQDHNDPVSFRHLKIRELQ